MQSAPPSEAAQQPHPRAAAPATPVHTRATTHAPAGYTLCGGSANTHVSTLRSSARTAGGSAPAPSPSSSSPRLPIPSIPAIPPLPKSTRSAREAASGHAWATMRCVGWAPGASRLASKRDAAARSRASRSPATRDSQNTPLDCAGRQEGGGYCVCPCASLCVCMCMYL